MTTTYTKSLVSDFGGNLNTVQLRIEINNDVSISPTCLAVINIADDVDIIFDSALSGPEQTNLDTVISSHDSTVYAGSIFVAHDSTGNISINSGFIDVPWDVEDKKDTLFTHTASSSEIILNISGDYFIHVEISIEMSSGNSRSSSVARIMKDSGSGFIEIKGTRGYAYHRNSSQGTNTISLSTNLIGINKNDKIQIEAMRLSGSGTLTTIPNSSRIQIELQE